MNMGKKGTQLGRIASSFSPYLGFHNSVSTTQDSVVALCPYLGVVTLAHPADNGSWTLDMWQLVKKTADTHNPDSFGFFFLLAEVLLTEETLPPPTRTRSIPSLLFASEESLPFLANEDPFHNTLTLIHETITQTWLREFILE